MAPLRVLVLLDGTEFSCGLVPHICRLLSPHEHELILLRVAHEPVGVIGQPPRPLLLNTVPMSEFASTMDIVFSHHPIYANQQREANRAALNSELMPIAHELEACGFTVKTEIRFGDPVEEILSYIRTEKVDVVAIGTHGRTGLRRIAHGSVTAEILRATTVPTLVVKLNEPFDADEQVAEILN